MCRKFLFHFTIRPMTYTIDAFRFLSGFCLSHHYIKRSRIGCRYSNFIRLWRHKTQQDSEKQSVLWKAINRVANIKPCLKQYNKMFFNKRIKVHSLCQMALQCFTWFHFSWSNCFTQHHSTFLVVIVSLNTTPTLSVSHSDSQTYLALFSLVQRNAAKLKHCSSS
jgi:hypothetical protein